jgi:hypothetical protein
MSELRVIETTLEQAAKRRRWQRAWRGLWQGLLVGGVVWLLALGTYKAFPIPLLVLTVGGVASLASVLLGFLIGWSHAPTIAETARWVDSQRHLQERLSTALEVAALPTTGHWQQLVLHDAAKHAQQLDARQLLPFRVPRLSRWVLLVLALGAGLGFVPEHRSKTFVQQARDAEQIKKTAKQLTDLVRRDLQPKPAAMETTRKSLEKVIDLGEQLQAKPVTRSEALKDLANLAEKLKSEAKDMSMDPALKRMEKAARALGGDRTQSAEALQQQMEALQKAMEDKAGLDPKAIEKLKSELQKLQQMAQSMMDKSGAEAEAMRQQLNDALNAFSKEANDLGVKLPELDDAIAALASSQSERLMKDLEASLNDLEKLKQLAQAMKDLKAKIAKMGKDLSEQLEKGQAGAAAATLKKMMKELEKSDLSDEQMKKMADEVEKALQPAGQYGKMAEHLQAALAQMRQGQRQEASQSLANAAKELEGMMAQLDDLQTMLDALDALKAAQMAIASGMSFGQMAGRGMPSAGRGNRPGQGVGTWADEDQGWQMNPEMFNGWDNSGVERADEEGRGVSDRGEGQLPDNLRPDKVKGKFTPGGQMPSITLRGVSIKGVSNVKYEEAAAAAQTEAQAALSQEKVPRAYQGAVKDYFDDLKK